MTREIDGLRWAVPCSRPSCIPKSRPRGAKAAGLRYEAAVAKLVPQALHNQWFEYRDSGGRFFCCPDLILGFPQAATGISPLAVVLECKLTWAPTDAHQLLQYCKIVHHVTGLMTIGVPVTKNLNCDSPPAAATLAEALALGKAWHCPWPTRATHSKPFLGGVALELTPALA